MVDLQIAMDLGDSGSKIVFQLHKDNQVRHLVMSSALEVISKERLLIYNQSNNWIGLTPPENDAVVEIDGQIVVVGELATKFAFTDRTHELKYENALFKTLAAIGAIVQKHFSSKKKKVSAALAILLPYNEYKDREKFIEKLETYLTTGYKFRNQLLQVKLETFMCRPEGGGLAMAYMTQKGVDWFKNKDIAFLMFGHRNITVLPFSKGVLTNGASPLIGFNFLLEKVISLKSGLDKTKLVKAIFQALTPSDKPNGASEYPQKQFNWSSSPALAALARARDPQLRQKEIAEIDRSLKIAASESWEQIEKLLLMVLPRYPDVVIASGGSAIFFRPLLEDYFNCHLNSSQSAYNAKKWGEPYSPIIWGHEIKLALKEKFLTIDSLLGLTEYDPILIKYRLMDVLSVFVYLQAKCASTKKNKGVAVV